MSRHLSPTRLLLLAGVVSFTHAAVAVAPEQKPSRVMGMVTMPDGKPAASILVKLTQLNVPTKANSGRGSSRGGGGSGGGRSSFGPPTPTNLMQDPIKRQMMTDAKGAFEFKALPVGGYQLQAGDFATVGYMSAIAIVEGDGKDVKEDMKLDPPVRE